MVGVSLATTVGGVDRARLVLSLAHCSQHFRASKLAEVSSPVRPDGRVRVGIKPAQMGESEALFFPPTSVNIAELVERGNVNKRH